MSYNIVTESDRDVDTDVKNKFSFSWFDRTIRLPLKRTGEIQIDEFQLRDFFNVSVPEKAICVVCIKLTRYGARGCKAREQHCESSSDIENLATRKTNYTIKAMFETGKSEPQNPNPKIEPVLVPMCDRIANLEISDISFWLYYKYTIYLEEGVAL